MRKLLKYLAIIALLTAAMSAQAQSFGSDFSSVRLVAVPQVPGPNEQVRLEVQGVGNFVGDANITWYKDGATAKSGIGERTYSFTTGPLGSVSKIQVVIESTSLGTITRNLTLAPAQVYLVWEAETSVPPLYRGKALYSLGARVAVTAFPQVVVNDATLSSNNLSFQWKRGDSLVAAQSGKGRNTFSFTGDQLQSSENITLDLYFGDVLVARGSALIAPTNPQILLYPRDPLRGVLFDQAMPAAVSLTGRELTVQAVPYFFSNESLQGGALTYEWTLGGRETSGPDAAEGTLTLRQSGEGAGQTTLGVSLQNIDPAKLLQSASAAVRIVFGAEDTNQSPFGI